MTEIQLQSRPAKYNGRDTHELLKQADSIQRRLAAKARDSATKEELLVHASKEDAETLQAAWDVPYNPELRGRVVIDGDVQATARGATPGMRQRLHETTGIRREAHYVWIDGAETTPGRIELPRLYDQVFVTRGDPDDPKVTVLTGAETERPYFREEGSRTVIYVDGFSGAGGVTIWRIPSDEDWKIIEGHLDSLYHTWDPEWDGIDTYRGDDAGAALAGGGEWDSGELAGHSRFGESEVDVQPRGRRNPDGSFESLNSMAYVHGLAQYARAISASRTDVYRHLADKSSGYSVFLLRDDTRAHPTGWYRGNNGAKYYMTKVGPFSITTRVLNETLYSDGTSIPEITDNAEWGNDTDGARCFYDNDSSDDYFFSDNNYLYNYYAIENEAGLISLSHINVATLDDLQKVGSGIDGWTPSQTYRQIANIDASPTETWNWNADRGVYEGFVPIPGPDATSFLGRFYGQGYDITGLYINREEVHVGLFKELAEASVYDVHIKNANISGRANCGILAGGMSGLIKKCSSSGSVSATVGNSDYEYRRHCGGLVGLIGTNGTIVQSHSSADVTANYVSHAGIGGFVGRCRRNIRNCYATGSVTLLGGGDEPYLGGFCGYNESSAARYIRNCYSTTIINVPSGNSETYIGGFVGLGNESETYIHEQNCFWDKEASGWDNAGKDSNATGKTTAEMKNIATYNDTSTVGLDEAWDIAANTNWDGEIWSIDHGNDYPKLVLPSAVVPNLVGLSTGIIYAITSNGFFVGKVYYAQNPNVPPFHCYAQSPAADTRLPAGHYVDVWISLGTNVYVNDGGKSTPARVYVNQGGESVYGGVHVKPYP